MSQNNPALAPTQRPGAAPSAPPPSSSSDIAPVSAENALGAGLRLEKVAAMLVAGVAS